MYARLGTSKFNYSNPLPLHRNYTTLEQLKAGNNYTQLDDKKYVISKVVYNMDVKRHPEVEFESQFFDKIKVPEQANVVQRPIAKDGR